MSIVHTITEGGQIWTHRFRMFKQVIKKLHLAFHFLLGLLRLLFACLAFHLSSTKERGTIQKDIC